MKVKCEKHGETRAIVIDGFVFCEECYKEEVLKKVDNTQTTKNEDKDDLIPMNEEGK